MQKTLAFLERNVQWFALALGGIFLLWAAWSYLINPPATIVINRATYAPGEIAAATAKGPAKELSDKINDSRLVSITAPDVKTPFQLAMADSRAPNLEVWAFNSQVSGKINTPTGGQEKPTTPHLASLPALPPAMVVNASAGMSTVSAMAQPGGNPAAAPAGRRFPVGRPLPGRQIPAGRGIPNPGAAPAPAQAIENGQDVNWAFTAFKVPASAIVQAFTKPVENGPLPRYLTDILRIEVQRQEAKGMDASGQPIWPADDQFQPVKPLKINQPQLTQEGLDSYPADSDSPVKKIEFANKVEQHPELVYEPGFYQVLAGTAAPDLQAIYAPPAAGGENAADANATQPSATQPQTAPSSQPDQNAAPEAAPPALVQEAPPAPVLQPDFGRGNPRGLVVPGFNGSPNAASGQIDPVNLQDDIQLWSFDENVKPGATYRYRLVYYMKNPAFQRNDMDEKFRNQFELQSPPSEWSAPVTVPERTRFWVKNSNLNGKVTLDVFNWKSGVWKKSSADLLPGDLIPDTDWTIADVRAPLHQRPGENSYVLLTNDSGALVPRDAHTDQSNQDYQALKEETAPPQNANPNTPAAPNRTVPPPYYRGNPRGPVPYRTGR